MKWLKANEQEPPRVRYGSRQWHFLKNSYRRSRSEIDEDLAFAAEETESRPGFGPLSWTRAAAMFKELDDYTAEHGMALESCEIRYSWVDGPPGSPIKHETSTAYIVADGKKFYEHAFGDPTTIGLRQLKFAEERDEAGDRVHGKPTSSEWFERTEKSLPSAPDADSVLFAADLFKDKTEVGGQSFEGLVAWDMHLPLEERRKMKRVMIVAMFETLVFESKEESREVRNVNRRAALNNANLTAALQRLGHLRRDDQQLATLASSGDRMTDSLGETYVVHPRCMAYLADHVDYSQMAGVKQTFSMADTQKNFADLDEAYRVRTTNEVRPLVEDALRAMEMRQAAGISKGVKVLVQRVQKRAGRLNSLGVNARKCAAHTLFLRRVCAQ